MKKNQKNMMALLALMTSQWSIAGAPPSNGGVPNFPPTFGTIYACWHGTVDDPYQEIIATSASPDVCPPIDQVPHDDHVGDPGYHDPKDINCRIRPEVF